MREFIKTGLYRHEPVKEWRDKIYEDNLYWCMNWTFTPHVRSDGKIYMVDTYFRNKSIEVTEENQNEWEFIFDFKDVREIRKEEAREYEEDDLFVVSVDSGGMSYPKYFVKKDTKKSKELMIRILEGEIEYLKSEIKSKERHLEELTGETRGE